MTDVDHYGALGVAPGADAAAVRAAHRAAVKRHHPDVGGDPERFRAIQRAWEVLGSEESRALYDAERSLSQRQTGAAGSSTWRPPGPQPPRPAPGAGAATQQDRSGDPIVARARHALDQRARLDALWARLEAEDAYIGGLRSLWHENLSDLDRIEVRRRHSEALDAAAARFAEAEHLAEVLGVDPEVWPPLPNLSALAGPPDELGFENPHKVWFVEPWDLLSGPLWMRPSPMLRVRAALWSVLVAVLFVAARRLGIAGLGTEGTNTAAAVTRWAQDVPLFGVAAAAAVIGAVAWPVLLVVGLLRRAFAQLPSRMVRCVISGALVAALVAGEWWERPTAGVLWVVVGAATGAAFAASRPVLAGLWVRWWTATAGARLEEWRRSRRRRRGPRSTGRRARRRAGLRG